MMTSSDWTVAIAGETLASRPLPTTDDPDLLAVSRLLRNADIAYAHLEMNFASIDEVDWPARGETFGQVMLADPRIPHDLRSLGIDVLSLAHNHSMDFGASGVLATMRHCDHAGIQHAGVGAELELARRPRYLEVPKGRVSLISTTTGNLPHEWASHPRAGFRGRPGVNPLRVDTRYEVDLETAERLKEVGDRLGVLTTPQPTTDPRVLAADEFRLNLSAQGYSPRASGVFQQGERCRIDMTGDPKDVRANLDAVREASRMSDLVLLAHHFSVSEGHRGDHPPAFVTEFAHAAIDAGADAYLGHGWHKTLGIEIYRGRPIFYGLGNFVAQLEFLRQVPYDSFEAWDCEDENYFPLWPLDGNPMHTASSETWWSSAVIILRLQNDAIQGVELHPVELGRRPVPDGEITRGTGKGDGRMRLPEGRPRRAHGADADAILGRLQRLSEPFGTHIEIRDETGYIDV